MIGDASAAGRRVFRFAPSPNGYLHRGHAFSALLNDRMARDVGGRFLLRIEDIDRTRAREKFESAIYEDLGWLGLEWEQPVLRQSDRFEAYRDALAELEKLGLLYPAFLSRAEIAVEVRALDRTKTWPRDPDGAPLYPGPERDWSTAQRQAAVESGKPYTLRLAMARALGSPHAAKHNVETFHDDASAWGDVVLARKEFPASYHLAVVVDDAFQGVTDVVRGRDIEPATTVHYLLQKLLGLPTPRYTHHRLILDATGAKFSKSRGSESIRARRAAGETPAEMIASLGPLEP